MAFVGIKNFTHTQSSPSHTWSIFHAFGEKPSVDILVDYNGELHKALPLAVEHTDENNMVIRWSNEQTGAVTLSSSFPLPPPNEIPPRDIQRTPMPPGAGQVFNIEIYEIVTNYGSLVMTPTDPILGNFSSDDIEFRTVYATYLNPAQYQMGLYAGLTRIGTMQTDGNFNGFYQMAAPNTNDSIQYSVHLENLNGTKVTVVADATYMPGTVDITFSRGNPPVAQNFTIEIPQARNTVDNTVWLNGDPALYNLTATPATELELTATTSIDLDPLVYQLGMYINNVRFGTMIPDGLTSNTIVVPTPTSAIQIDYNAKLEDLTGTVVPDSALVTSSVGSLAVDWLDQA